MVFLRDVRICLLKLNQVFVPFNLGWDTTVILQNSLEWGKFDKSPRTKRVLTPYNSNLRCPRHRFHRRDYRILQFGICGCAGADHWRHSEWTNDWLITRLTAIIDFQIHADWVTLFANQRAILKHQFENLFQLLAYKQLATSVYNNIYEINKRRWGSLTIVF